MQFEKLLVFKTSTLNCQYILKIFKIRKTSALFSFKKKCFNPFIRHQKKCCLLFSLFLYNI